MNRRLRPDFLGIGAPRSGTTSLHHLLSTHPEVAMPARRKELNYFTRNYRYGERWYIASFDRSKPRTRRVGEISPCYLYQGEARQRIRDFGGIEQFIVCLRHPVDRVWSQYQFEATMFGFGGTFDQYLRERPDAEAEGFYARALAQWFEEFDQDRFLLLRFDVLREDPAAIRRDLASFLGIDQDGFAADSGIAHNAVFTPRFPRLYSYARRATRRLHRLNASWLVNVGKRAGLDRHVSAVATSNQRTEMPEPTRRRLEELYADDQEDLRAMTGISFTVERAQ